MKSLFHSLHSYFVPKEENNFKAKALHLHTLTAYLFIVLLAGILMGRLHTQPGDVLGYATDISTGRLMELTNQKRSENGLSQLTFNDKLAVAAAGKAQHMFANNYWAHYSPDGTAPWGFILNTGYEYKYAGENLAKNFMFSGDVVEAWMNSPTHRQNLLRAEYTEVGFAVANGALNGEETTLVVQMFATPQSAKSAVQADTQSSKPETPQATLAPTQAVIPTQAIQPTTIVQREIAPSAVLARQVIQPAVNLFPLYMNVNYVFMGIFAFAILLDFYLVSKMRVIRISGKNLAHFIFIAFMLAGLFIVTKGAIL